jgi:hypothetical protein
MIVRISGEDQYELSEADAAAMNELEQAVIATVDGDREAEFAGAYSALLEFVRSHGAPLGEDDLRGSDVILPPADITFAEAGREFTGEGIIPE